MRTLAIDASSKSTGIALFEQSKLSYYECITASSDDFINRIEKMVKRIRQLYDSYEPDIVIMEQVLPRDVNNNQNIYKILIYLQAAIAIELHRSGVIIDFVVASHWRKQCGIKTGPTMKRKDLKQASQKLVKAIYGIEVNDDISDAICLGIAYLSEHRSAF